MLIQFRVENHRSLRDEQTLSLVAVKNGQPDDGCLLRPEGLTEALLPAVAIYGANASGKTNVLHALEFMTYAVLSSHRYWEPEAGVPQQSFALSDRQNAPSTYEVDIVINEVRYRYGFSVDNDRILQEWLYAWPSSRRQIRFERDGDAFDFGRSLGGDKEVIRTLTRRNSLYLSAGAQNNHPLFLQIFGWFQNLTFDFHQRRLWSVRSNGLSLRLLSQWFDDGVAPETSVTFGDDTLQVDRERISQLLQSADTGIVNFQIVRESSSNLTTLPPRRPGLYFQHKTDDLNRALLPVEAESAGTIALFGLAMRLVPMLRRGGLVCIDELEASLHPALAGALVRMFCDPKQNPNGAQLIFTTHDTNLLGGMPGFSALRRDQVWLTEKDNDGATHLYPLTDFHPRKYENLERGYLQGRYGAVPFLGELLDAGDETAEQP